MTNIMKTALFKKSAQMWDAVNFLCLGYKETIELIQCYENTKTIVGKQVIVGVLCRVIRANIHIEEEIFYPVVKRTAVDKSVVSAAIMRNSVLKYLTAEIATLDPEGAAYDIKVRILGEHLKNNFTENQRALFQPVACSGKIDLWELGARLIDRKKELLC